MSSSLNASTRQVDVHASKRAERKKRKEILERIG